MAAPYDMTMIRVFLLVFETKSVSVAAERLFVSQPAVSYSLAKLRRQFDDQLFIRRNQRLVPTQVAEHLYPRLRQLTAALDDAMGSISDFEPATSGRTFRLMMTDVGVTGLLPKILKTIARDAPGIHLEVEPLDLSGVAESLRTGKVDACVCTPLISAPDVIRHSLFSQPYVGVCAPNHPRITERPSLEQYSAERHVGLALATGHHAVDQRILELGIRRNVVLTLPSFMGLVGALAYTEYLSFAPSTFARRFVATGEMRTFELPFDVRLSEVALYTLKRELPSPEADWLTAVIRDALTVRQS
ncbi:MAG: LysR family transcriptional regulator [Cellulosimicrobium cellulans]